MTVILRSIYRNGNTNQWTAVLAFTPGYSLGKEEGEDRMRATYRGNYARLAAVKAKYDPENFFRVNQTAQSVDIEILDSIVAGFGTHFRDDFIRGVCPCSSMLCSRRLTNCWGEAGRL